MNKTKKISAIALSLILCFAFLCAAGCSGGWEKEPLEPLQAPVAAPRVYSVTIRYNDTPVAETLSVNMTVGTVELSAAVLKDEQADGTVTWESGAKTVATVTSAGLVTLLKSGETVISASVGGKKHEIVLVVGAAPTQPSAYTITVNGGTADVSAAIEGARVTLSPVLSSLTSFIRWEYRINGELTDSLSISGHLFLMPAANVVITGIYEHARYSLNLIGATVSRVEVDNEEYTAPGVEGENTKPDAGDGELEEYALIVYQIPVGANVEIETVEEPAGKMFVGWDFDRKNNRLSNMNTGHDFTMPDTALTVWAQFSVRNNELLTAVTSGPGTSNGHSNTFANGFRLISQGKYTPATNTWTPDDDAVADPDLDGGSGYRLSYSANQGAVTGGPENITGSYFNTMGNGTLTMKWIFKNHSTTRAIVLEAYATQLGNNVSTGLVRIEPGEVRVVYVEGRLGVQNPWMGCVVREAIGGTSGEPRVLVDMVCIVAPMYPDGDKILAVSGNAQWVTLTPSNTNLPYPAFTQLYGNGVFTYTGTWANRDAHWMNNAVGLSMLAAWGANISLNATASSKISNIPAYDANQPHTTIYLRVVNNIAQTATYKWGIATTANSSATFVSAFPGSPEEGTTGRNGGYTLASFESKVIKLVIPRSPADNGTFYLTVVKTYQDTSGSSDGVSGQHICMQMAYNNVLGYTGV